MCPRKSPSQDTVEGRLRNLCGLVSRRNFAREHNAPRDVLSILNLNGCRDLILFASSCALFFTPRSVSSPTLLHPRVFGASSKHRYTPRVTLYRATTTAYSSPPCPFSSHLFSVSPVAYPSKGKYHKTAKRS